MPVVLLFLLVLFSISSVGAADLNGDIQGIDSDQIQISDNNNIEKSIDDAILDSQNPLAELQNQESGVGDASDGSPSNLIDLESQVNETEEEEVLSLTNDYVATGKNFVGVNKGITIDGQGHTIDCTGHNGYVFYSAMGEVTLKNLIIKNVANNLKKLGGAIFIEKTAEWTIINCTFENNYAQDYGGAIYNGGSETLTIINSTFINNKAKEEDGGAIFSKAGLVIEESYFEGNSALVDGGAIFCQGSVEVSDTEFVNNKAFGAKVHKCYGGAICAKEYIMVDTCSFSNNVAENYGGAIYAHKELNVIASNFTQNSGKEGGALYGDGDRVFIEECRFIKNSANTSRAGAIYANKFIYIGKSLFENNTSQGKGGAIYSGYIQFDGESKFINNSAKSHGGAIYTDEIASQVSNLTFNSNHARDDYGGALYINKNCREVSFNSCIFANNIADAGDGGAIHSDSRGTYLKLYNCTFTNNHATGGSAKRYGGAVCSYGNVYVNNCTFNDNWAQNKGGAIYCYEKIDCVNSHFKNDRVYVDGGGSIYTEKLGEVKDSTFEDGFSQGDGGAIYINLAYVQDIHNSYFKNNYAKGRGGAIYTDPSDSRTYLYNNVFIGNRADNQGDDVFVSGTYAKLQNNWWGTNNPSFSSQKLMEYKVFGSNKKHSDSNYIVSSLSGNKDGVNYLPSHLKISFTYNVPAYLANDVLFSSDKDGSFNITAVKGNAIEFDYIPNGAGSHKITVKINSQVLTYTLNIQKTSVFGEDLVKVEGRADVYSAVFLDSEDNFLPVGTTVKFNVNGSEYVANVKNNGVAKLYANLEPGVYDVKAINPVTGETFSNKITVLPDVSNSTFNINDTYIIRFLVSDNESAKGNVTFNINGKTYTSNITEHGLALLRLDVAPGDYVVTATYQNTTVKDKITVINQYSKVLNHLNGTSYGSLLPIYNNESFTALGNLSYSVIGENTYRYILPSLQAFVLYNVTVSNSAELTNALRKMSKSDYNVDVTVINLKYGTYKITESFWKDRDWDYLIHLTHGKLFINGNGATIDDDYNHNFIYANPNTVISIDNLTIKSFYRCFVNYGELYCANTKFVENEAIRFNPITWSTKTLGAVVYNLNKATFDHCVFDCNRNREKFINTTGWHNEDATDGGVLYAETNSFTNFVSCRFNSIHDNIHAASKSMVVFYDDSETNYKKIIRNSFCSLQSSVGVRSINSFNVENIYELNYSDVNSFLNVHTDTMSFNDASGYIINLENKIYSIGVSDFEKNTLNLNEWRTPILDPGIYLPNKDKGLLDMDSRSIIVKGNGATIQLTGNEMKNDYHFAIVPKYGTLTLVNLTLSGFNSAILNYGTVFIINCTFKDNRYHTFVNVDNGGAIQNYGGLYCHNSTFTSNWASKGGAIYCEGVSAQCLLVNCDFSKNQLTKLINIILYSENNLHITQNAVVKVINCTGLYAYTVKTEDDGLLLKRETIEPTVYNVVVDSVSSLMRLSNLVSDNEEYDIINVTFVQGDYMVLPDSKVLFEMDYGKLIINGNGSRIFVLNPKVKDETQFLTTTLRSYVILDNLLIEGFNIAIENSGNLDIYNSIFLNNKVDYLVKNDYGGAIVNDGTLSIFNSIFKNNYAKYGGAIYNKGNALVMASSFTNNTGYKSKSIVDIYTHEGNLEIIAFGIANPKTIENFPMSQFQEDVIHSATYLITSGIFMSMGYGLTKASVPHWIISTIGTMLGGVFGAVEGYIYANDHEDYSSFWTTVFEGMSHGMEMIGAGEDLVEHLENFRLKVDDVPKWDLDDIADLNEIYSNYVSDEIIGQLLDKATGWFDDFVVTGIFFGSSEEDINVAYVPTIV